MARKKKGIKIDGWINVNKPLGVTSTQAVGKIRYALKAQKVGHGGTLDPLATGILPIALGEATKTVNYIQDAIKTYNFTVTWGEQRTTDDGEGEILETSDKRPTLDEIEAILPQFIGDIEQTPPQFSAVKIGGERAYDIARDGDYANIKSRKVHIENISVCHPELVFCHPEPVSVSTNNQIPKQVRNDSNLEQTSFKCICGKGTYIRSLARDMGQILGCFGYISTLERSQVGPMALENAISLDIFQQMIDNPEQERDLRRIVLPLQTPLDDIPVLALKDKEAVLLKNGNNISLLSKPDLARLEAIGIDWRSDDITTALVTYDDMALAMVEVDGANIQPVRVFNLT